VRIRAAAARATPKPAERARAESWSHERFLEAVLSTEVASRESHGGEGADQGRPPAEQGPIGAGDRVLVESGDGLTLNVSRLGSGGEDANSEAGPKGAEA
jgi:hypothetical protein